MDKHIIEYDDIIPIVNQDETSIVFQRHANYDKQQGILLDPDKTIEVATSYFTNMLSGLSEAEKNNTFVLFIASNTSTTNGLLRSFETTEITRKVAQVIFAENGIPETNIININPQANLNQATKKTSILAEPKMFTDNTGYLNYLTQKYGGINKDFWIAFESDIESEYRLAIGAEGPDEIVSRGLNYLEAIKRYATYFHNKKPNSRLIVWSGTHYDLISPFVKQVILGLDKEEEVKVKNNAGICIMIDAKGRLITNISGVTIDLGELNNLPQHRHF